MAHELVVFDNSGVLVDSESLGNRLLAGMLTDEVAPTTFAEAVEHYLGKSFADMVETVRRRTGAVVPDDFGARFHARLFDTFERELTAVDGVHEVLDDLDARNVPYCVASNDTADRVAVSLGLTGLAPRLAGRIFGADQVARPKPAPDVFLHAARRCGVAPEACLVIEDSARGVAAARAAGMTVYGLASVTPRTRLGDAQQVLGSMRELRDLIPALFPDPLLQETRR
ncbi:HAD-IA family hydrolase [Streptomyces tubercidicus]|uniref:Hydrolase n=1 Tax=Streptomyces tubercidicus TaxID=47759 RepID=A0A640UM28_9ACTN|nr:HAD-IA family hydrolase [Streptomyces tubercidicus]WAU11141.1 HAD-IA family hydrolase [Streptomyces tubercidicus]WSK34035.1 HAD-IA family hydrolase [Streptomyces tubercidicus]WSX23679.1 HAD-IA family hydrolase [Streptomyces tubercidicus]GFE36362.1 hydrolase [Streptomyces tubercidicus]